MNEPEIKENIDRKESKNNNVDDWWNNWEEKMKKINKSK